MNTELEVKYNILRGDCYRLSKKLEYYESGKAFESLKADHEKEVRRLSNKLSAAEASKNCANRSMTLKEQSKR